MRKLSVLMFLAFAACESSVDTSVPSEPVISAGFSAAHPLRQQFACLPDEAAIIAAHRAVSKGKGLAENSKSSLEALIERGILVAEVDVAGLKDGTHILYHDGVWEEDSTGQGAVAATTWAEAEKFLLLDTDNELTADRPYKLNDALALAKDKMYLEIDFKSSAKYETVIQAIRDADMADRVILIAYTDAQARRMSKLTPDMMLSVGIESMADVARLEAEGIRRSNINAWLGRGPYDDGLVKELDAAGIPILAWPGRDYVEDTADPARLIVTDYAFEYEPILGMSDVSLKAYLSCLEN